MSKRSVRTIRLPCFGIAVRLDRESIAKTPGAGAITSDLKGPGQTAAQRQYNAAVDGLESLVLAHACAGLDVNSPAYLEGIETAVEAITNHYLEGIPNMFRTRVGTAVRITEFNPAKSRAIIAAVLEVWPFEGLTENGSVLVGLSDTRAELTATVTRNDVITEAAWRANEAYCVVQVFDIALDDEDRHYQDHYDRLAYGRWQEGESVFFHPNVPPVKGEP